MWRLALASTIALQAALACGCLPALSDPSLTFLQSEVVFTGRLIQTDPDLALYESEEVESRLRKKYNLTETGIDIEDDPNLKSFPVRKEFYGEFLPTEYKARLQEANTMEDLAALFEEFMKSGVRYRFRVMDVWKGPKQEVIDLWQEMSSCAKSFERNEPVLVYADHDESGRLTTHACTRGGPLSLMTDDLVYLYLVRHSPKASTRMFGFVTSDGSDLDSKFLIGTRHPVADVLVELKSAEGIRTAVSASNGRFTIDGLPEGAYTLRARKRSSNSEAPPLYGPVTVDIPRQGPIIKVIYIPADKLK